MRKEYISTLYDLAKENRNIIACISDNGAIVYDRYRADLPDQYINFGISEANMLAAAAGMASCGLIPFVYTISNFMTMRAFEFIRNDICINNANVKIVGTGAGFAYSELGPTHHATEDIALMRVLPNMTILSPSSPLETIKATRAAAAITAPVYLRIGTGNNPEIYEKDYNFKIGKGVELYNGDDITVLGTGTVLYEVIDARKLLAKKGISVKIINLHTIKPIDDELILQCARETGLIVTVEEHSVIGGLGDAVADVLRSKYNNRLLKIGLEGNFAKGYGTYSYLKSINKLDSKSIVNKILSFM